MHETWEEARVVGFPEPQNLKPAPAPIPSNCKLQKRRCNFFLLLSGGCYSGFAWMLFVEKSLLRAAGSFCLLFIALIFLAIDLRKVKKKLIRWTLGLIGGGISLFLWKAPRQLMVVLRLSLGMIWFLILFLRNYFQQVRKVNRLNYFTSGGYLFTTMTAILFGLAILGINSKFPFQCEQISWRSQKIIQTSTAPFSLAQAEEEKLRIPKTTSEYEQHSIFKKFLITAKTNLVDSVISTQKSINQKVCEAIVEQVEKVYQNPVFQIGAIFGMYLLFYGVIRLFVWVITMLGYAVFWIAKRFGRYQVEKKLQEVEEVL